jgi:hypothetical protein
MKKKIINGILAAAILVAAPSAFVSCKDNDADLRTELLGKIADLKNQLDAIQLKQGPQGEKGDKGDPGSVVTIGPNGNWFIDGVDTGQPSAIKGDVGEKGEKGDNGEDGHTPVITIGDNGNWFIDGEDTGKPARGEKGDKGDVASVITIGENGNWFIDGVDSGVPARGEKGDKGDKGDLSTLSIGENGNWFIDGVDTGIPAQGPAGAAGKDGVTPVLVKGDDGHYYWWINGQYTGVRADGIDGAGTVIDGSTFEAINGTWWIDGVDTHILAYTYEEMVKLIKDQIYNAERDGLTPELEDIIKKLLNNLDNSVQKSVKDMITDVIVERTENSLYGQLAIPGFNPLILSAFYGETKSMVFFPDDAINITNAEQVILDGGEEIKGDGGKVILTLNPAEASIAGKTLTLETSQGKASPFTLSGLTEYNGEITFGWNRTRAANGLYEATAELNNASAAGIAVNTGVLKDDVKVILNDLRNGAKVNVVKGMAALMADFFTDAIETIPAYTVKTSWNDPLFGPRSVRSGYDIAAFSIKPLAYDFEYSTSVNTKPYVDKLQYFIDKVLNKASKTIGGFIPTLAEFEIKKIKVENWEAKVYVKFIPGQPVYEYPDGGGNIIGYTDDSTVEVKFSDLHLVEIAHNVNDAYDDINGLNDVIKAINGIADNIESAKNSLKAQIHDYLDVYVNKFNAALGSKYVNINWLIQPTLLVKSSKGISRAKGSFNGEIGLLPTSRTGELLAPAYKKFVVVTEVDGNPATAADNNGDLGTVLDGGVQEVKFTPAAGKTYTIAYSAMDYFGNIVTNYYLISGK